MPSTLTLPAIPWSHTASDLGSVWVWTANAFTVTVNGSAQSYYWQIADTSADPAAAPAPFADGQSATFEQAELAIREVIGKAYDPTLGYQQYAGPLATTFTLADGTPVDLAPFNGRKVTVVVASRNGPDETVHGHARVDHYELVLTNPTETIRILPSHIASIHPHGTPPTRIQRPSRATPAHPATNRTYPGTWEPGCTGKPGYLPDTIDHAGPACPLHETRNHR